MNLYTVAVYSGIHFEKVEIKAENQAHLKQRVKGLGYDRMTAIHNVRPVRS